jgi:regulator of protease activity HflC (stomatin/prohibitin superfamily)
MLYLKYLLEMVGISMLVWAAGVLLYELYLLILFRQAQLLPEDARMGVRAPDARWKSMVGFGIAAWLPLILAMGIVVVPSGMAGVRVSQTSGTLPGTLYSGAHFVTPLVDRVEMFNTRDQLFTTGLTEGEGAKDPGKSGAKGEFLRVQAKEGLNLGLAITVRYRIDPRRLDFVQANLPQPVEKEIVPAVVATVWREIVPTYTVRDVFSAKREEVRKKASDQITLRLAQDGIVVKEVMLRDVDLPEEYAKGLETMLLKEQENDRMGVETELHQKQVKISELDAEATKVGQVKQAEGQAQIRVLQAKGEADAMQYLLPLKTKQIEQSRLEAEAHKETTVKDAEAQAQARVIDSKAEMERRNMLSQAEAQRIRVTAVADAERMKSEAVVLKENPLLINKIIAERLSDKLQIMMVPADGKFFFTNDVMRSMSASHVSQADVAEDGEKK